MRATVVVAVGAVGAARFAADEAFQPLGDNTEDCAAAVAEEDAPSPPVCAPDVDGSLAGADGFGDGGDGKVGHGVGGAGVRLNAHGLGLRVGERDAELFHNVRFARIPVGVFFEAEDADDVTYGDAVGVGFCAPLPRRRLPNRRSVRPGPALLF